MKIINGCLYLEDYFMVFLSAGARILAAQKKAQETEFETFADLVAAGESFQTNREKGVLAYYNSLLLNYYKADGDKFFAVQMLVVDFDLESIETKFGELLVNLKATLIYDRQKKVLEFTVKDTISGEILKETFTELKSALVYFQGWLETCESISVSILEDLISLNLEQDEDLENQYNQIA